MLRSLLPFLVLATASTITASAQEGTTVTVDVAIGRDVVDRMPVDTASTFPADVGRVVCWTRVTGAAGTTIQHVWIHGENEYPVSLEIGGTPWRTWSTKVIPAEWAGEWRVEVRDAAGTVLATARFSVGS
jgi:hypothetical protein